MVALSVDSVDDLHRLALSRGATAISPGGAKFNASKAVALAPKRSQPTVIPNTPKEQPPEPPSPPIADPFLPVLVEQNHAIAKQQEGVVRLIGSLIESMAEQNKVGPAMEWEFDVKRDSQYRMTKIVARRVR